MLSTPARVVACFVFLFLIPGTSVSHAQTQTARAVLAGMPTAGVAASVYSDSAAGMLSPATAGALSRVYVPNLKSGEIFVIDPATFEVVDRFRVGGNPQHVVPSWDLATLWVAGSAERKMSGSLTPINPQTGKPGATIKVRDAYNLYFTPDGRSAIVVAEALRQLEFRDPQTMKLQYIVSTPQCYGLNHADFSADGSYALFTCEFSGSGLVRINLAERKVDGYLKLTRDGMPAGAAMHSMPQDIRISPDGSLFYVADMEADGVFLIDAHSLKQIGFIPTGRGAHGLYPSRDGKKLYVANRGTHMGDIKAHGPGSISVIDFATRQVEKVWTIPGGGSPDMGNVSADGKFLWLSGRFDQSVYAIDTTSGEVTTIAVGSQPHGLTIWPQPGRYSLGHTGVMR